MAKDRLSLHEKLCEILGSRNCYFEAPSNIEMLYPCIRYKISGVDTRHADNKNFINIKRYLAILITEDQDTELVDKFLNSDLACKMATPYLADGLYHFPFNFYW